MARHLSDTDLERYCLGMIQEGPKLDALEDHLLICGECVDRAQDSDAYIEGFRRRWYRVASARDRCVAAKTR